MRCDLPPSETACLNGWKGTSINISRALQPAHAILPPTLPPQPPLPPPPPSSTSAPRRSRSQRLMSATAACGMLPMAPPLLFSTSTCLWSAQGCCTGAKAWNGRQHGQGIEQGRGWICCPGTHWESLRLQAHSHRHRCTPRLSSSRRSCTPKGCQTRSSRSRAWCRRAWRVSALCAADGSAQTDTRAMQQFEYGQSKVRCSWHAQRRTAADS